MRWSVFFIFAYVALGLQTGLARAIEWNSAVPDFVLIAVIFILLNAPRDTALLAAFILGGLHDMTSQGVLGLWALCYALSAAMVFPIAKGLHRRHPAAQFALVLAAGIVTAIIISLHTWIRPPTGGQRPPILPLFSSAVYSAILAPFVLVILQRTSRIFRFQRNVRN